MNNNEKVKQRTPREARARIIHNSYKKRHDKSARSSQHHAKVTLRTHIGAQSHEKCCPNAPRWCPRLSKVPQRQPKVALKGRQRSSQGSLRAPQGSPRGTQKSSKMVPGASQETLQETKGQKRTGLEREPFPPMRIAIFPRENVDPEMNVFRNLSRTALSLEFAPCSGGCKRAEKSASRPTESNAATTPPQTPPHLKKNGQCNVQRGH